MMMLPDFFLLKFQVQCISMFCHNLKKTSQFDQQAVSQVASSVFQFLKSLICGSSSVNLVIKFPPSESMKINIIRSCYFNCFQIFQKLAMSVKTGLESSHSWNHLLHHITQQTCPERSSLQPSQDEAMAVWHTSLSY